MSIEIIKSGEKYIAKVFDGDGVLAWSNENPLDRESLISELVAAGCHPRDIHDEFEQVEPISQTSSGLPEAVKHTYMKNFKGE